MFQWCVLVVSYPLQGCFFCGGPVHVCMPEGFLPQGVSGLDYCRLYLNGTRTYNCPNYNECQELSLPVTSSSTPACACLSSSSPSTGSSCGYCSLSSTTGVCYNDFPDRFYGYGSFTKTVCENQGGVYRLPGASCAVGFIVFGHFTFCVCICCVCLCMSVYVCVCLYGYVCVLVRLCVLRVG